MARVVRYCVRQETHTGDNVFPVHRPSVFGNPYTHIRNKTTKALYRVKTREQAIELYDVYFDEMVKTDETFREEFERMYRAFCEYDIIYIGCYCALTSTCHGDIIANKLRERAVRETLAKDIEQKKKK